MTYDYLKDTRIATRDWLLGLKRDEEAEEEEEEGKDGKEN
jgi:hypothetical protein